MRSGVRSVYSVLLLLVFVSAAGETFAQSLYEMPEGVESRWASGENPTGERGKAAQTNGGRKGAPTVAVKAGESRVLAEAQGASGTVRRIWMTFPDRSPRMLRSLRLDMYWDGAKRPAVSAPLGDFFGVGLGQTTVFQSALFSNPEGRSFNCFIPMPFKTGMRVVLTNESDADLGELFYDIDYTLGDRHASNMLYFHAHFRRENPTRLKQDYEILPRVTGRGRYLGTNVGVIVNQKTYFNTWWGEGEVKIYLDGDRELPTLSGTGTEDYVGTAWGQGAFAHDYQGSPVADEKNLRWCFYRYHVPDPVYFHKDIRVTIQQIGYLAPHSREAIVKSGRPLYRAGAGLVEMDTSKDGKFERADDWSSCAYFYLDRPENNLPPLDPVAKRIEGL
ncbi:MAG TPA: glycoside hydrolase family 172 protein [Pyrinomonadaceae bacterium]|nr:glycoside hydrolase family 172 protein [Pyrinomonadaceae bacterium]